jgi:hypothetical protein
MAVIGYILLGAALVCYVKALQAIQRFIGESNLAATAQRFTIWRWPYAWKTHSRAFPSSPLRRRIVTFMLSSWCFGCLGIIFVGQQQLSRGWK